jgi:cell division protein FtsA
MRRRYSDHIIVGLDIGTTKILTVVGEIVKGTLEFLGVHMCPSAGMRKGIVVNMEGMIDSIRDALKETGSSFGVEINSVYASISGAHIKGSYNVGTTGIGGREVTYADIDRVFDSARTVYVPLDREILHVIPAGYSIDGQNGIKDPIGMTGERLEAKVYAITGAASSIQNLLRCCEKAGVEVADMVFAPVASAGAVLSDDERELGVALIDIGGGTTDILLYKDGLPHHASVLAVGGNHFTNDVAVGLKIPVNEAERIKKSFGAAARHMVSDSEKIEIVNTGEKKMVLRRHLAEILQARTEEFLDLIRGEFGSCSGDDITSMGVVLTGGGALLKGLERMAEEAWGLPVRVGSPRDMNIHGAQDMANNPESATGAGLVHFGFEASSDSLRTQNAITGIFGTMRDWAKEIFKIKKGGIEYVRN